MTNALICVSLAIASGVNIGSYFATDSDAMSRLTGYAEGANTAAVMYEEQEREWVKTVGDGVFTSKAFKRFAEDQSSMAMDLVDGNRDEIEAAAIDGFNFWWNKKKAEPLVKDVYESDVIHARHAGQSAAVQMAKSTCDGVTVPKADYAAAGLTTTDSVAVYKAVVEVWTKDACEKVGWAEKS